MNFAHGPGLALRPQPLNLFPGGTVMKPDLFGNMNKQQGVKKLLGPGGIGPKWTWPQASKISSGPRGGF